ncbi:MAG TPA: HD-GYP domain-containing protein [Verrucomicrobiae bacterium]|nr:HD-GYP domain-containing protein [Verrucomicrobiae bacterium]
MKANGLNLKSIRGWLGLWSVWWLVLYAVVWLGLGMLTNYSIEKQFFSALGRSTGNLVMSALTDALDGQDLSQGVTPELSNRLDRQFERHDLKADQIKAIKLLDASGKIIYATDKSKIGEVESHDLGFIGRGNITANVEKDLFSVFVPFTLHDQAKALGTLEIYVDEAAWVGLLHNVRLAIWAFIAIGSLLMLGSLGLITNRATYAIATKDEVMKNLGKKLDESNAFLARTNSGTVSALLTALDAKDRYTAKHSSNVATLALQIGYRLDLSPRELETLETAAILHDIGKIGIPEQILNKRGSLNSEEFAMVKRHAEIGAQIVHVIYFLEEVGEIVLHHHERYDGLGYPRGIAGHEIPLTSRILAVADVYDALVTDRPYRSAMPIDKAIRVLEQGMGTQFDPNVVKVFLQILSEEMVA